MSGLTTTTGVAGLATTGIAIAAAVDPSVANIIGIVVGAVVTVAMGLIAYKTAALNRKLDEQKEKIDQTLQKTEKIEGHVNSEKTRAEGEIAGLQKEVLLLREVLADKKQTAALLAQAVVVPKIETANDPLLVKIEKNAGDTAANTLKGNA